MKDLGAHERNAAAFIVVANPFARTGAPDATANNEIIALNHL